jgi:hypothetical protein
MMDFDASDRFTITCRRCSDRKTTDPDNPARTLVWNLLREIIDNTIRAFNTTVRGVAKVNRRADFRAGELALCLEEEWLQGLRHEYCVTGPMVILRLHLLQGIATGAVDFEFQWRIFNVFSQNFNPDNSISDTLTTTSD